MSCAKIPDGIPSSRREVNHVAQHNNLTSSKSKIRSIRRFPPRHAAPRSVKITPSGKRVAYPSQHYHNTTLYNYFTAEAVDLRTSRLDNSQPADSKSAVPSSSF